MEIKTARDITRKYTRDGRELSPILASDWIFEKEESRIYITSELNNVKVYFSTALYYLDNFIFNKDSNIINNKLEGIYYLTSLGIVSEDEFYEAESIVEIMNTKIKEVDLERGKLYLSNKGIKYLYIGKLNIDLITKSGNLLEKETIETISYLYDIANQKIVKLKSIKLVSFLDEKVKNITIELDLNEKELLEEPRGKVIIYKLLNTEINEVSFLYFYINNIERVCPSFQIKRIVEFKNSNESTYILQEVENQRSRREEREFRNNGKNVNSYMMEDGSIHYSDQYGNIYHSERELVNAINNYS